MRSLFGALVRFPCLLREIFRVKLLHTSVLLPAIPSPNLVHNQDLPSGPSPTRKRTALPCRGLQHCVHAESPRECIMCLVSGDGCRIMTTTELECQGLSCKHRILQDCKIRRKSSSCCLALPQAITGITGTGLCQVMRSRPLTPWGSMPPSSWRGKHAKEHPTVPKSNQSAFRDTTRRQP